VEAVEGGMVVRAWAHLLVSTFLDLRVAGDEWHCCEGVASFRAVGDEWRRCEGVASSRVAEDEWH
jgi:hypothetical protein